MENTLSFLLIVGFVAFVLILSLKFYGLIYSAFGIPGVILFFLWSNRSKVTK